MSKHDFTRKSGFFFLAANAGSVVQFFFQAVMRRMLTDPQFGLMNTLFCMMNVMGTVAVALQMELTRRTALVAQPDDLRAGLTEARRIFRLVLPWGILFALAAFLARQWLAQFFNVRDPLEVIAVGVAAASLLAMLLAATASGYFAGMRWFGVLAILALGQPLLRIALGSGLVRIGMGTSGAVIATVAIVFVPLVCLVFMGARHRPAAPTRPAKEPESIFWIALLSIGVNTLLTNADLMLVKHYFPSGETADFAEAGVFGRAMIFFLGPLGTALLPLSTVQVVRNIQDPNRMLRQCLKLCLILGVSAAALGGLLAAPALRILNGRSFAPETVHLLRFYLWAMLPIALVTVIMNHVLAINARRIAMQAAALAAIYPLAVIAWHPSLLKVLLLNFVFGSVILLFLLWKLRQPVPVPSSP